MSLDDIRGDNVQALVTRFETGGINKPARYIRTTIATSKPLQGQTLPPGDKKAHEVALPITRQLSTGSRTDNGRLKWRPPPPPLPPRPAHMMKQNTQAESSQNLSNQPGTIVPTQVSIVSPQAAQTPHTPPLTFAAVAAKTAKVAQTMKFGGQNYEVVGKGAEKVVIKAQVEKEAILAVDNNNHKEQQYVYFIPVTGLITSKEKALKAEYEKMKAIKQSVPHAKHLAIDATEVQTFGQFALQVKAAKRDFEDHLRNKTVSLKERFNLCKQYVAGTKELHEAGWAFGDIKPENCLIYEENGKIVLRISDFGKAQKVPEDGSALPYRGNLRFCPPEGFLSAKGDVYGAALVMIRALEDSLLESGAPLVEVEGGVDASAIEKRRGVEKYIVEHKAFLGMDEPTLSDKIFRRLPRQVKLTNLSDAQKQQQKELLEHYIDKLTEKLYDKEGLDLENAQQLNILLKWMIEPNPDKRPTAAQVSQVLSNIK